MHPANAYDRDDVTGSVATVATAKPAQARLPSVSGPSVRSSARPNPQAWSNSASRSRDGGVLSIPKQSGSPAAWVAALPKRSTRSGS